MDVDAESLEGGMIIAGLVRMNPSIPTFATPILQSRDGSSFLYIQSSSNGRNIEDFIRVPSTIIQREGYVSLRYNNIITTGDQFWVGFCDHEMYCFSAEKNELKEIIDKDFELYQAFPFLQWTMCHFYQSDKWLNRLSDKSLDLIFEAIIGPYWSEITAKAAMRSKRLTHNDIQYDRDNYHRMPGELEDYFRAHLKRFINITQDPSIKRSLSASSQIKVLERVWINYDFNSVKTDSKIERLIGVFMSMPNSKKIIDLNSKQKFLSQFIK